MCNLRFNSGRVNSGRFGPRAPRVITQSLSHSIRATSGLAALAPSLVAREFMGGPLRIPLALGGGGCAPNACDDTSASPSKFKAPRFNYCPSELPREGILIKAIAGGSKESPSFSPALMVFYKVLWTQ